MISETSDGITLELSSTNQNPTDVFSKFQKEHPEYAVESINGYEKKLDPETKKPIYSYTLSLRKDSSGISKQTIIFSSIPKSLTHAAKRVQSKFKPSNGHYSFTPIKVIKPDDPRIGLLVVEKSEFRQEYNNKNVAPIKSIEEFLLKHRDMRLIGFDKPKIDKNYEFGKGDVYKRDYSLTAIYASTKDFPELERIARQEIHAYTDLPGSSIDSKINGHLNKLNKPFPARTAPKYEIALRVNLGKVYVAQRDFSMGHTDAASAPVVGYRPEDIVVLNAYKAPEITKKQNEEDRSV